MINAIGLSFLHQSRITNYQLRITTLNFKNSSVSFDTFTMSNGAISKLKRLYDATHAFVTEKGIELYEEGRATRFHRFAHLCLLVGKSFNRNRCPLRATALAYTTLLAIIPLLAVGVGVASTLLKGQS